MKKLLRTLALALTFIAALALARKAHAATFSGPGLFISLNQCADIQSPVDGQTWCFDAINYTLGVWNAALGNYINPAASSNNLNYLSLLQVGGLGLVQQSPPSSVTATATCSGTCATTYTYEVTCVSDSGETTPSAQVTATNSNPLTSSNTNTINWATQAGCIDGYNVYGRISGSLGLIGTVSSPSTTTFVDNGSASTPTPYKFTFSGSSAEVTGVIFDLRNQVASPAPIDVSSSNGMPGVSTIKATSITTTSNHDTQIPVFGWGGSGGTITPPGGFSNITNVAASPGSTRGIWSGTKDLPSSGATGASTASIVSPQGMAAINIAVLPANPAVAITVIGSASASGPAPAQSITLTDPASTATGDLEVACISFTNGSLLSSPATFHYISTAISGSGGEQLACYWNAPQTTKLPPTTNTTGIITQSGPLGTFRETLVGLIPLSATTANTPNGSSGVPQMSWTFPVDMTVQACRATWFQYAGCSPYPTWAMKDITAGVTLCSTGTVSNSNTDEAITPSNFSIPANDVIQFLATVTGVSCTGGNASIYMLLHE